jgi:hypothetical protein
MAVLQISKIQVRRGQKAQAGIPTLSAGEFAWAVDAQELFIGNGSVSEGAPFVGNTRLLTELDASNIFKLAGTYSYEGNTSATVITGPDANSPISRTLQDKLDDFVNLKDFGAIGDGATNDTKALQRAIDQVYLNSDKANPSARKKLYFPAGTYLITGTIYVPSFATIQGDGIDRTIIKQSTTATAIFQTVDFASTTLNKITYPSIQSTTQPKLVDISKMTVQYDSSTKQTVGAFINVDCAINSRISEVKFLGLSVEPSNDSQTGIEIRGQGATTTVGLRIEKCEFNNLAGAVNSNFDVDGIIIEDSTFRTVQYGIVLANELLGVSPSIVGPRNVIIRNNNFNRVYRYAVYAGPNSSGVKPNILTDSNTFIDCGNNGSVNLDDDQQYPIIIFESEGNRSVNDIFSRTEANNSGITATLSPEILGHVNFQPSPTSFVSLTPSSSAETIIVCPKLLTSEIKIEVDYIARQPTLGITRTGKLEVMTNYDSAEVSDNFQYVGATALTGDISFSASLNTATNILSVAVLNPTGSVQTDLTYHYNILY